MWDSPHAGNLWASQCWRLGHSPAPFLSFSKGSCDQQCGVSILGVFSLLYRARSDSKPGRGSVNLHKGETGHGATQSCLCKTYLWGRQQRAGARNESVSNQETKGMLSLHDMQAIWDRSMHLNLKQLFSSSFRKPFEPWLTEQYLKTFL